MRVLLDENLPIGLAGALTGHEVATVAGLGWQGVRNGELLRRAAGQYEALVTMDRNIEFQQALARQPYGAILLRARANRLADLRPLVPAILDALNGLQKGEIKRVGA